MAQDNIELYPDFLMKEHFNIFDEECMKSYYIWDSTEEIPFQGFIHRAFPIGRASNLGIIMIATYAVQKIVEIKNLPEASLKRAFINILPRGLQGGWHNDTNEEDSYTLIINTSKVDGGTEIGKQFFKNNFNEAILFNSNLTHRGIGPQRFGLYRSNLAIVIKTLKGTSL